MKQELKNRYYSLIENNDYNTLSVINLIFNEIDTLLLVKRINTRNELLKLINVFKSRESKLYVELKNDIEKDLL